MTHDHSAASVFVGAWIADLWNVRLERDVDVWLKRDATKAWSALDLAMGRGRHALLLARAGFQTFGVDINADVVRDAVAAGRTQRLEIHGWCADLTQSTLPASAFDLLVVARYLQRDLFEAIKAAVRPGGCVIYETFTIAQLAHGVGPKSPDHLLQPGELRSRFADWNVLFYEEADAEEAVARLVAQRPLSV